VDRSLDLEICSSHATQQQFVLGIVLLREAPFDVDEVTFFALERTHQMISIPSFLKALWVVFFQKSFVNQ
jgi:hypothetical protein